MGMNREEILNMRFGTFVDMISCMNVFNGGAKLKKKARYMAFEEAIELK